jgi:uncharacterized protein YbcC (UPF0753/DUF2309 family)
MTIAQILDQEGQNIVRSIQNDLDRKGLTNTGATKRSLNYTVESVQKSVILTVRGAGQLGSLQFGAATLGTKNTGGTLSEFKEAIKEWAKSKLRMTDESELKRFVYFYTKKRLGDGIGGRTTSPDGRYVVPNPFNKGGVISDTVNDELIKNINSRLVNSFKDEIISMISETIQKDA